MRKESDNRADFRLASLAARAHSVVSTAELLALGLSDAGIARRMRSGRLHRKHRGVYAVGHPRLTQEGAWLAAVKACGPKAVLSHQSAAQLSRILSLADYRGPAHVTVPGTNGVRQRRGIVVHRSTTLARSDRMIRDSIAVTNTVRTLTDLRRVLGHEAWLDAIDRARFLNLPIADLGEAAPTRSRLERRVLALCRRHRLPTPETNAEVGPFLIDFVWRDRRLVVEVDGYEHHRGRGSFESDRARDAKLTLMGYRVVRITWRQLTSDPAEVAATIRSLLEG